MKQRLTMLLVSLFLCVGLANAQTQINGTVTSADDGQPVIGASVMITGTKTGVVTNVDGKFSLTSNKKNPMITVSYIGMKSQTLHGTQNMRIVLHSDAQKVDEVVVTGMQKMDKRLFTGAATKVDAEKAKLDGVADISRSESTRYVLHTNTCHTYRVLSVRHRRFVCVVLPLFMVAVSRFGW